MENIICSTRGDLGNVEKWKDKGMKRRDGDIETEKTSFQNVAPERVAAAVLKRPTLTELKAQTVRGLNEGGGTERQGERGGSGCAKFFLYLPLSIICRACYRRGCGTTGNRIFSNLRVKPSTPIRVILVILGYSI